MIKVLGFLVGLVGLLLPSTASASGVCPTGTVGSRGQCVVTVDRNTTCAWPLIVNGERVAFCLRQGVDQ